MAENEEEFEEIEGEEVEMEEVDEDTSIDTILTYCGFNDPAHRESIAEDGFESFDDIKSLTGKDLISEV